VKKYYKLTDQNMQTFGGFQWEVGKWVEAKGDFNKPLCSNGWLHCYESPLLAVLHNPIHADIKNPRLFEVEVRGKSKFDKQLKCGFRKMRLTKEIPLPKITINQITAYGILCAKNNYKNGTWIKWANDWLSGKDRSRVAACVAADAIYAACVAAAANAATYGYDVATYAATAAACVAADAAHGAACAADAAIYAADAAAYGYDVATYAADAVAEAATYATYAANAAACVAADAAHAHVINLIKIAEQAIKII